MARVLNLESFPFPKTRSGDLKRPQKRVLRALTPPGDGDSVPVLARVQLAERAGFTRISGILYRALHGIHKGSPSGSPYQGLLDLGFVEEVELDGIKAYQITPAGSNAAESLGELPELKDKAACTNHRYLGTTLTEEKILEGRRLLRLHKVRERKRQIVSRKKKSVRAATGSLLCEACGFDFAAVYGKLGEGFAECHHRLPLADYDAEAPTLLEDLAIVCANCHRMLHRSRPMMTVEQLRSLILQRRTAR